MAVLDIQRRGQQIGRLRMGQKIATGKLDKSGNEIMRPVRLPTDPVAWGLCDGMHRDAHEFVPA